MEFQERISQRNGLSEETYLPEALHQKPPVVNMAMAREEACCVMFGAVSEVLERTGAQLQLPWAFRKPNGLPVLFGARRGHPGVGSEAARCACNAPPQLPHFGAWCPMGCWICGSNSSLLPSGPCFLPG